MKDALVCQEHTASRRPVRAWAFHEADGGFSTPAMAIALLVALSLLFGSAQVYRVQSACAHVQNVADAAALAAQNQVASFYVAAQACDSVSFSLSMAGTACLGAGVVALCVPGAQAAGERLVDAGVRLVQARDRFAQSATAGLGRLQQLLPFLAAAQAASVAAANGLNGQQYAGIAVLAPFDGKPIASADLSEAGQLAQQVVQGKDAIKQAAQACEQASQQADEHKMRAYMADCGAAPDACMYERAAKLAGMGGASNPHYGSVDAWSFGVGLARAQAYYPRRLAQEAPDGPSAYQQAASAIRTRFYAYACRQMERAYVHDTPEGFDAYFPLLPRNTQQMRETELYTEAVYPVVADDAGQATMHAWDGCPAAAEGQFVGYGSVQQWEQEGMQSCPECGFSASRVGKVAAASTSIANGFEHHYLELAQQAQLYQQAREEADRLARQAKDPASRLLEAVKDVARSAAAARIEVSPPGRIGVVAVVVAPGGVPVSSLVPSSFVADAGTLGTRAAIAGATLADDDATETANVISSLADGLAQRLPALGALPQAAARIWGGALGAYTKGHDSLVEGVRHALDSLPLVGRSGLGSWASGKLAQAIDAAGFSPPQLSARKPVLVNTYHIASRDDGSVARALVAAKQSWGGRLGNDGGSALAALAGTAGGLAVQRLDDALGQDYVVARIQLLGESGPSLDVRISMPQAARDMLSQGAVGLVEQAVSAIRRASGMPGEVRRWE